MVYLKNWSILVILEVTLTLSWQILRLCKDSSLCSIFFCSDGIGGFHSQIPRRILNNSVHRRSTQWEKEYSCLDWNMILEQDGSDQWRTTACAADPSVNRVETRLVTDDARSRRRFGYCCVIWYFSNIQALTAHLILNNRASTRIPRYSTLT